jgi:hypothetical protein
MHRFEPNSGLFRTQCTINIMSLLEPETGEHITLAICACRHQKEGIENIDFVNRYKLFEGKTGMDLFKLIYLSTI